MTSSSRTKSSGTAFTRHTTEGTARRAISTATWWRNTKTHAACMWRQCQGQTEAIFCGTARSSANNRTKWAGMIFPAHLYLLRSPSNALPCLASSRAISWAVSWDTASKEVLFRKCLFFAVYCDFLQPNETLFPLQE